MARSRHAVAPCGSGVDEPRRISSSDDAMTSRVSAQSDHARRLRARSVISLLAGGYAKRDAGYEHGHTEAGGRPRQPEGDARTATLPALFPRRFNHDTTLQHYRLPDVTASVTNPVYTQKAISRGSILLRI